MNWFFGSSSTTPPVSVTLSSSTTQGRSAPSEEDDSRHKNRGLDQNPTATLYSNRSAAYCALGLFQEAKEDADQAIVLDPHWAKTYSRKGKALYGLALYKKAADAYARGLEICLRGAVGEAQQRDRDLAALKRQTDSQAEAYLRLLEENNQLKRQVEDYQHMFGDWTKKEM